MKFRRKLVTSYAVWRLCCINTDPKESTSQKGVSFHGGLYSLPLSSNSLTEFQSCYMRTYERVFWKVRPRRKSLHLVAFNVMQTYSVGKRNSSLKELYYERNAFRSFSTILLDFTETVLNTSTVLDVLLSFSKKSTKSLIGFKINTGIAKRLIFFAYFFRNYANS